MSFTDTLTHTCTIQRATATADPLGLASKAWAVLPGDVACRLTERSERAWSDAKAGFVVRTEYTLLIGADEDIAAGDRVSVTLEDGTAHRGIFEVNSVVARRGAGGVVHHKSAALEIVA